MPSGPGGPARAARESLAAIERFLASCRRPVLLEPGETPLTLLEGNYLLELRASKLTIQAWDDRRNLVRRVAEIRDEKPGKLELTVERFGGRQGLLLLIDMERPSWRDWERRGARLVFREQMREYLQRQFPEWRVAELSAETDLEHSLSPAYPRALLTQGRSGFAAIGADQGADPAGALAFGLIWLDYLRRREARSTIHGLVLFIPAGREKAVCLRLRHLRQDAARFEVFSYSEEGFCVRIDPADSGNLETRLEIAREPSGCAREWVDRLGGLDGVETIELRDGTVSFRVRGLEFARTRGEQLLFGMDRAVPAGPSHAGEISMLARELDRMRHPRAPDRHNPLYGRNPEAWLESQVRGSIETLDATLMSAPIYGQVPAMAGGDRGVIDLLACDRSGRLAVIELKATADLQLPLQALDYWMRVKWHAERDEFGPLGYFPGLRIRPEAPRLLLVSPALEFHPTTEAVLQYFRPEVPVERIGVGVEWRCRLEVMFRLRGAETPS